MRRWEATLRRDATAWQDFKDWLNEESREAMTRILSADNREMAAGEVVGITRIIVAATANEREEIQRARTS